MKIQWEKLKNAESGWKLNFYRRAEILENCIQGRKVRRFSWKTVAVSAAYVGFAAAVVLLAFFLWPHIAGRGEINDPSVIIGGNSSIQAGDGNEPHGENPPTQEVEKDAYFPVQIITKDYQSEKEEQPYVIKYEYGMDGTLLTESGTYENAPAPHHTASYQYDEDGRLIGSVASGEAGDSEKTYEYDENNRLIKCIGVTYGADLSGTEFYEYDAQGRCIKATHRSAVLGEDDAYHTEVRTFEYGPDGTLCKLRDEYGGGIFWIYHCSYDTDGNLIELIREDNESNRKKTVLIYDEKNRCIKAEGAEFITEYTYDDAGNIIKETQKTKAGKRVLEREYTYQFFENVNHYSAKASLPMDDILGDLRAMDIGPAIHLGQNFPTRGIFKVEKVVYNNSKELERLTAGELGKHFDYEIYYLGIKEFYLNINGKTVELREALKQDPTVVERLYELWYMDHGNKYMYSDGGSREYPYTEYRAIKMNQLRNPISPETNRPQFGLNRDLILTDGKSMNDVDKLIMINGNGVSADPDEDQLYQGPFEDGLPIASFVLRKDGRFTLDYSIYSTFYPQGKYSVQGDRLILQTTGEFDYKYVFKKVEDGWSFVAAESARIPSYQYEEMKEIIDPIPDGTVFKLKVIK